MRKPREQYRARRPRYGPRSIARIVAVFAPSLIVVLGAVVPATPSSAASTAKPVTVPITTRTYASAGNFFPFVVVDIRVAGGPLVPVQLDTGSSGLEIFSNDVGTQAKRTNHLITTSFGTGRLVGTLATGPVSIGNVTTSKGTGFAVVSPTANSYLASVWRQRYGVVGILGIGTSEAQTQGSLYSPLLQLPAPYWQGTTLHVATTGVGSLVLGPVITTSAAVSVPLVKASPPRYPNGTPAYQVPVNLCWSANTSTPTCGPTAIDLGSTFPTVDPAALPNAPTSQNVSLASGTAVQVTTPSGTPLWTYTSGNSIQSNVTVLLPQSFPEFNTGIEFFFQHTVAYNVAGGQIVISLSSM